MPANGSRIGLFLLRAALACVPLGSLGLLSWVPLTRVALVRRRAVHWVTVGLVATVSVGGFVVVGSLPDSDSRSDLAMGVVLLVAVASTVWFLVAELTAPATAPVPAPYAVGWLPPQPYAPYPQPQPGYGPPYPPQPPFLSDRPPYHPVAPSHAVPAAPTAPAAPAVPLGQVQAELDELSALLHGRQQR